MPVKHEMGGEVGDYLDSWSIWVTEQKARRDELQRRKFKLLRHLSASKRMREMLDNVREIFALAASATQNEVRDFIQDVVTFALQYIYGEDISFCLDFKMRRNQSEITPVILQGGEAFRPRDDVGGGVVDIASFALRLTMWALEGKKSRPTFIFDEPFKFVSKDKTDAVAAMLKELTGMLEIQLIMVSHDDGLIEAADRSWTIETDSENVAHAKLNLESE